MMKLSALLAAAASCLMLAGAEDPAYHGNMLAAFHEENPRIRCGAIVGAMESSPRSIDRNAVRMLERSLLADDAFDRILYKRLSALWAANPGNLHLAKLCAELADRHRIHSPEDLDHFHRTFRAIDFKADRADAKIVGKYYVKELMHRAEYPTAAAFADELAEKYPDDCEMLDIAAEILIRGGFMVTDTAPGMKGYAEVPPGDFWKSRQLAVAEKIRRCRADDTEQALAKVTAALRLRMPDAAEFFRELSAAFPGGYWWALSIHAAERCGRPELYLPSGDFLIADILGCIASKNFGKAEELIGKIPKDRGLKTQMRIMLRSAQSDHAGAVRLAKSGAVSLDAMLPNALLMLASSAHVVGDTGLLKTIVLCVERRVKAGKLQDAACLNAVGYSAADRNIELDRAEHFIRLALVQWQDSSAFLDSLAWVLYRRGKTEEAEETMMRSLECIEPSASAAVLFLHAAAIKASRKKYDEARTFLRKAKKIYDPDADGMEEYDTELVKRLEKILP